MRTIGVITVGRSDYSIYLPVLERIREDPELRLHLIVGGMHLSDDFGTTVHEIENDGFHIAEKIEMLEESDTPEGIAQSISRGTAGFASAYSNCRPDIILVLGDRFEMLSAVVASLPFNIPVAHIHGGELTEGAIDEVIRHSITKMSHLHFVATEEYAQRVIQMGEDPRRVIVSGAPSLDNLNCADPSSLEELESRYQIDIESEYLLVTFHPVTREYGQTETQMTELIAALDAVGINVIFTYPNADTGRKIIMEKIHEFVQTHKTAKSIANLGTWGYFDLMKHASAMVGNSSSGIIEAPSFRLPVVNIGDRQRGRLRAENVIDVPARRKEVQLGIQKAISRCFHEQLKSIVNPYGTGIASLKIVNKLKEVELDSELLRKPFYDLKHS